MASVNKVILVGYLGKKPELRQFPNGGQLATFSLATGESWVDKNTGERKTATEWHNIVLNGRLAEIAEQYLDKGSQVYIEGKLKTDKWQDQHGVERYTTKIYGSTLQMLGGKGDNAEHADEKPQKPTKPPRQNKNVMTDEELRDFDDDIPF